MNLKALKKSFQLKEGLVLSSLSVAELDAEHAQKVLDMEHTQQMKLKERQKFFEEAFQQDMEQYLSTGYLQIAERRGKCLYFPTIVWSHVTFSEWMMRQSFVCTVSQVGFGNILISSIYLCSAWSSGSSEWHYISRSLPSKL